MASRYVNRVKDTIIATYPEKYTREVNRKVVEDWRKINRDSKLLERKDSPKGFMPSRGKNIVPAGSVACIKRPNSNSAPSQTVTTVSPI